VIHEFLFEDLHQQNGQVIKAFVQLLQNFENETDVSAN